MKIVVFRAFRDPYRTSMKLYADAIERRVAPWLAPNETLVTEELPAPRLEGGWRRYWDTRIGRPDFRISCSAQRGTAGDSPERVAVSE